MKSIRYMMIDTSCSFKGLMKVIDKAHKEWYDYIGKDYKGDMPLYDYIAKSILRAGYVKNLGGFLSGVKRKYILNLTKKDLEKILSEKTLKIDRENCVIEISLSNQRILFDDLEEYKKPIKKGKI